MQNVIDSRPPYDTVSVPHLMRVVMQEADPAECGGLQVALVKLTRTSWHLTFEAVAAAFTAAADALAHQLTLLAGLGCAPCTLRSRV